MTQKELKTILQIIDRNRWLPTVRVTDFELEASKLINIVLEDVKNEIQNRLNVTTNKRKISKNV